MFSPHRCYAVAHHHLRSNLRTYIYMLIGLAIGLFAIEFFCFRSNNGMFNPNAHYAYFYENLAGSQWVCFFIVSYALVSITFSFLKTKQSRIAYLMLPATNAEKFVAHTLFTVIFILVGFAVAYVVGDLLRILLFAIMGGDTTSAVPYFLRSVAKTRCNFTRFDGTVQWDILLFVVGFFLWAYSCYLLGSVVFRRRAFLKTILVQMAILYLFGLSVTTTKHETSIYIDVTDHQEFIKWVFISGIYLFTVLHVWVAYRLHNRLVVIPRRLSLQLFKKLSN